MSAKTVRRVEEIGCDEKEPQVLYRFFSPPHIMEAFLEPLGNLGWPVELFCSRIYRCAAQQRPASLYLACRKLMYRVLTVERRENRLHHLGVVLAHDDRQTSLHVGSLSLLKVGPEEGSEIAGHVDQDRRSYQELPSHAVRTLHLH